MVVSYKSAIMPITQQARWIQCNVSDHRKYGSTFLKCTLRMDSGTVLKILNSFSPVSFTYIMAARLLQR